jgi:hypothetical protein
MKTITLTVGLSFVLAFVGLINAGADTLYTDALFFQQNFNINCVVTNVSASTETVKIQIYKSDGSLYFVESDSVASKATFAKSELAIPGGLYYCRFTVADKATIRASIQETSANFSGMTTALSEAR